jgi:hypothetical protein
MAGNPLPPTPRNGRLALAILSIVLPAVIGIAGGGLTAYLAIDRTAQRHAVKLEDVQNDQKDLRTLVASHDVRLHALERQGDRLQDLALTMGRLRELIEQGQKEQTGEWIKMRERMISLEVEVAQSRGGAPRRGR